MLTFNFDPFPELVTKRLHLRKMVATDADAFFELRSNRQIMQYIARPLAETPDDALQLILSMEEGIAKNDMINWGITLKGENKVIGTIGYYRMKPEHYRAEVGYLLHGDFHKKGIMQEALEVVLDHGFDQMKLHSIEAVTDPDNTASQDLLLRNKFVKEAYFKENHFFEGKFLDSVHYSLLKKGHTPLR